MTRIALIFGVGFGLSSYCALARPSYLLNDTTDQEKQQCINILSASGLSYKGQTDEGNRYDLYAIKMKKEWVFIVWDGDDPYSFRPSKEADAISENSLSFTYGVCKLLGSELVWRKDKYKVVGDIPLAGYYTLTSKGRTILKSLNYLEYGPGEKSLAGKILSPITGLFKPKG